MGGGWFAVLLALSARASAWDIKTVNIHRDPAEARRLVSLGETRLDDRRYNDAIAAFQRATQADPESVSAYFHLADARYQKAFQKGLPELADPVETQNAIEDYQTALALDPKLKKTSDPFPYFHGLAQCYSAVGRYPEALETFKRAADYDQDNPMPDLYAAELNYRIKDPAASGASFLRSAKRALRAKEMPRLAKLVQTDPLFEGLLTLHQNQIILRSYLAVQKGALTVARADATIRKAAPPPPVTLLAMRDVAAEDLRDSLRDRPRKPTVFTDYTPNERPKPEPPAVMELPVDLPPSSTWVRIGVSYRRMGLAKEAVRTLERAVTQKPQDPDAHYQLAASYALDGQADKALTSLNWALSACRTSEELQRTVSLAQSDPLFEPLRDLPRYKQILRSHRLELAGLR